MLHWRRNRTYMAYLNSTMLKRISAHKLLLILVIALIARPAMSVMAHDMNMAMGSTDTAIHCHEHQAEADSCNNLMADIQLMNCDKCSDTCSSPSAIVSDISKSEVLAHPHDFSIQSFILSRRNEETFRPPIHS